MKSLLLSAMVITSFNALAVEKSGVYCREYNGKVVSVLSGDWQTCTDQLYTGEVCFAGKREVAIKILNSDEVRQKFDGTDGEYIKNARFHGPNSIAYLAVDEANEWSNDIKIERCPKNYVK